jgi:chromate transporter
MSDQPSSPAPADAPPPVTPLWRVFGRFLKLGCCAWGGPVPQIAMLRHEGVEVWRWLDGARFNRALAVYQVLPGPEATEMAVYLGMVHRGRLGGVLAGLGFILPGLVAMLVLAWLYVRLGAGGGGSVGGAGAWAFAGAQAAVAALIVIATWRLGNSTLKRGWLVTLAVLALLAHSAGVHFAFILLACGLIYWLIRGHWTVTAGLVTGLLLAGTAIAATGLLSAAGGVGVAGGEDAAGGVASITGASRTPGLIEMAETGLRAGLLTFGGAYTALPMLERDAVQVGGWMSQEQLLDGIALTTVIPAPLVTLGAFVGYLGAGLPGALVLIALIYLPAFSFTLLGHSFFERMVAHPTVRVLLDGVTAGLIGLMAGVAIDVFRSQLLVSGSASLRPGATVIFLAALAALHLWRSRIGTPAIIASAALLGLLVGWLGW